MKKSIAALSALVILFVCAACKEEEKELDISENAAYVKYVDAVAALNSSGSFDGELSYYVTSSIMSQDYEMENKTGIKYVFGNADNPQVGIDATLGAEKYKAYFKDGMYYYVDYSEYNIGNFKFAMQGDSLANITNSSLVTDVLFSEEDILELEAIEDADGVAIRFVVSESGMRKYLRTYANFTMTNGSDEGHEADLDYTFDDVVVMTRFGKKNELTNVRLLFLLTISHYGEEMVSYIEIGMQVSKYGDVVIDFPQDLESFQDLNDEYAQFS